MTMTWLPGAHVHDLHPSIGNGPFQNFLGVALHVNVAENGTPDGFWGNGNANQVCPNFQVMKSEAAGGIRQMLPLDWQPWCQIAGNFNYAAIETAGMPSEPLTDYQLAAIAKIVKAYHDELGMPLVIADSPGQRGLITHKAGGVPWGGHECPGTIRTAQRPKILALAGHTTSVPSASNLLEEIMALSPADRKQLVDEIAVAVGNLPIHFDPSKPTATMRLAELLVNIRNHSIVDNETAKP